MDLDYLTPKERKDVMVINGTTHIGLRHCGLCVCQVVICMIVFIWILHETSQ